MDAPDISNKFQKKDRLCSRKAIELLFEKGRVQQIYPFRIVFNISCNCTAGGLLTMVVVPKKHLKRSVDRNQMKRLMRESFRTRNQALKATLIQHKICMEVAFIFTSKKLLTFASVEKGMALSLNYLLSLLSSPDHSETHPVAGQCVSSSLSKDPDNQ